MSRSGVASEPSLAREYLEAFVIALVFALFARTFVVQAFQIPTASMEENLLVGDHILVNKFVYGPTVTALERRLLPVRPVERGDVVVFRFPGDPRRDYIKRCVALPGDEVALVDKTLQLNREPVDESAYVRHTDPAVYPSSRFLGIEYRHRDNYGPLTVEEGGYFCLGDNRDESEDSRSWGLVPRDHVKGRAVMIYWSFDPQVRDSRLGDGLGERLRALWRRSSRFVADTRWERTFRVIR